MKSITAVILAVALLFLFCACGQKVDAPQESLQDKASSAATDSSISSSQAGKSEKENSKTIAEPKFIGPQEDYRILFETPFGEGTAVVYDKYIPELKKTHGDTFYGIFAQTFDANGEHLETIDFGDANINRITEPVFNIEATENQIRFEVRKKDGLSPDAITIWCYALGMNERGVTEVKPSQTYEKLRTTTFRLLEEQEGFALQYGTVYDEQVYYDKTVLRLSNAEGYDSRVVFDQIDATINAQLMDRAYGEGEEVEDWLNGAIEPQYRITVKLDSKGRTATVENEKTRYFIDFDSKQIEEARSYTKSMLTEQVALSPNGKSSVWRADERNYFEASGGCDFVAVDENGEMAFLFAGIEIDELCFIDDNTVFANRFDRLAFYDANGGRLSERQPGFDFGIYKDELSGREVPKHIVVGSAVDYENSLLLLAYRTGMYATVHESEEIRLAVLSLTGEMLRDIPTGFSYRLYNKFSLATHEIVLQNGLATIKPTFDNGFVSSDPVSYL